ncbi:MAG: SEC-C metal-binding domain-containing protein [Planctomycetota bacterium]|jgi:hypothetical protein
MNARRNDPCPCGSGKKYKKCCLTEGREREVKQRAAPPRPDGDDEQDTGASPCGLPDPSWRTRGAEPSFDLSKKPHDPIHDESRGEEDEFWEDEAPEPTRTQESRSHEEERAPLDEVDAFWEQFEEADYEGRIAMFLKSLDEPDLLDNELAFAMIERFERHARKHHDWEQLEILIRALQERNPDVYTRNVVCCLSWLIDGRVSQGKLDALAPLAKEIAEGAGDHIDSFNYALDSLAYHCDLATLVEMMRIGWPGVRDSTDILEWGVDEYLGRAFRYEMLEYCLHATSPRADDPELGDRLRFYLDSPNDDYVTAYVESVAGQVRQPAKPRKSRDEWCIGICREFVGDLVGRQGVSPGRAELGVESLREYLLRRLAGDLKYSPTLYFPGEQPAAKKKRARDRKRRTPVHALCPDAKTLEPYLAGLVQFLSSRYHTVAATFELIPAWLRYLESRELISREERSCTLTNLVGLRRRVLKVWNDYKYDPSLHPAAVKAWEEEQDTQPVETGGDAGGP